ncbi:MAG: hypothetical protein GOMPHAMPRED_006546 [Gomphillus americanus]|uniref:Sodium bile acid symporter family protein n=1 Tax=Gomphillus americanus TaxID=1940652 RepID=A0A8H3FU54_9LECA|nr:MAG: hypothetical protein GOMPHAMPRED_006546 [Gomphillus americanus]
MTTQIDSNLQAGRMASKSNPVPQDDANSLASVNTERDYQDGPVPKPGFNLSKSFRVLASYLKEQWFLLTLGVLIAIASQRQVPEAHQELKETVVTYLCVAIIFLITGCTLPTRVLLANYSRWKIHIFVQIQCFLMTSATVFAVVSATATNRHFMDAGLLIGMILTGVVPTTISSNVVLTRQANGNTALTVVQSTLGNLLGPFIVPLLLQMYTGTGAWYTDFLPSNSGDYGAVYQRVFKQLGLSLFLPLFVGQVLQNVFPRATETVMKKWGISKLSSFCLLIIIWSTYDQAFQSGAFNTLPASNIVFVVFMSIAFFIIWLTIAFTTARLWLPREDVVAVCYCVPAKTPAMGVPLVQTIYFGLSRFDQSKLQIPMVFFQGLQIAGGSLLIGAFRWWVGRDSAKPKFQGNNESDAQEQSV